MPAFLLSPLLRWGIVALVIAALTGGLIWERHEATVARESQAVAERQAAISAQDAERWQAASGERDARLVVLSATLDQQSAEIEAGRAKEAALRVSLDSMRLENDRLSADVEAAKGEIAEEARKAPGDIRDVGPIVARRAAGLFN